MNSSTTTSDAATATSGVNSSNISPVVSQFPMADQIQPQTPSQSQLISHSDPPLHLKPEIHDSVACATVDVTSATITSELPNALTHNSTPSTKLVPLRPRKIRKISPDTASAGTDLGVSNSVSEEGTTSTLTTSGRAVVPVSASKSARKKMVVVAAQSRAQVPRLFARSLSYHGEIERALQHLQNVDPLLAQLISIHPPPTFDSFQTPFLALSKSILYQQLACKAGTSIYARFVALCGGEDGVLPDTVLALTPQQLRQIGVSGRKASYLHDLARKYKNGILCDESIINMDDKSLFTMLTMVNGIGSWSVHMFMIYSLHRPDVLPVNDLGIRKGVQLLYGLEELPRPSQMENLCDKWRPYRSVASWYLWRLVESKGTPSSAVAVSAGVMSSLEQQHQQQEQQQLHHHHHMQQEQQLHHRMQSHHPQQQEQQPPSDPPAQFIDPINGMINLGACAWGQ